MREIKFRGKRVDNDEWVYGMLDCIYKEDGFTTISYVDNEGFYCEDKVDYETVGQFTGLFDKNCKEIYEGDIIKATHKFNNSVYIGEVYFEDFTWFGAKDYLSYIKEWCIIEVVGNIHDNKELLND